MPSGPALSLLGKTARLFQMNIEHLKALLRSVMIGQSRTVSKHGRLQGPMDISIRAYLMMNGRDKQIPVAAVGLSIQSSLLQFCRQSLLSLLLHQHLA